MNPLRIMQTKSVSLAGWASALLVLAWASPTLAVDDVPKRVPFDRYSGMMNKSPFAVATAVAAPAATPNFAKDLYVANAARLPDGDLVTVQSATDRNLKEYLTTRGPNEHGYAITNIEWSDKPARTKVTISKDGQFATLGFNQSLMTPGAASTGGQPPPLPQQPPPSGAAAVPPPMPMPNYAPPKPFVPPAVPTPPPHTRGLIQRNPSATQKPNAIAD
jgi:hypothetical protein